MSSILRVVAPYIVASALSFGLGIAFGIWIGTRTDAIEEPNAEIVVAFSITFIWAFSVASDIALTYYSTSVLVHGIMGGVSGFLFSDQGFTINIGE